jgi:hypothetical protein
VVFVITSETVGESENFKKKKWERERNNKKEGEEE